MALSYLSIPGACLSILSRLENPIDCPRFWVTGTSVDIERIFSRGRLILPHVRNGLSADSIRALLCLGEWSLLDLVDDKDVEFVVKSLPDLEGNGEDELEEGWDRIVEL